MFVKLTNQVAVEYAKKRMFEMFELVPYAKDFHLGEKTNLDYYKRHLIETVLRIRLNNEVDSYSLYKMTGSNHKLSVKLAQYLAEELGHENFFLNDLRAFGITVADVDQMKPFFSTQKLIGYMYYSINVDGPLPTMIWSWFVEWYSDTFNPAITAKASELIGERGTAGFIKHIEFDESHDHVSMMFKTIDGLLLKEADVVKALTYIDNYVSLIGDYFKELYDSTLPEKTKLLVEAV